MATSVNERSEREFIVDPTSVAAPFLAQGAMGAALVVLAVVIWKLWQELKLCQITSATAREKDAELNRQLLERVLTSMNTMGGVVADNTKAMEMVLKTRKAGP